MNKRYEEGRKPFFSESGKTERKQYVWAKDKNGKEYLQETESIDIQGEIESYADECDIKNIVRKASFDPQFMQSLSQGALNGTEVDITEWPQNIHEYHRMIATAQTNAIALQEMQKEAQPEKKQEGEVKNEQE
nr:MAG TPA: Scaffold protein [Microviridae sp.]